MVSESSGAAGHHRRWPDPGKRGQAIARFDPWGVDVVSGVERETGKKDEAKLRSFVAAVRTASDSSADTTRS